MIGADGLMMTAAHVIHAAVEKGGRRLSPDGSFYDHQELYVLYMTSERHGPENNYVGGLWPVHQASLSGEHDVALCWLQRVLRDDKPIVFPVVRLSPGIPQVGQKILGFGYHSMNAGVRIETHDSLVIQYSQKTAFTKGQIAEVHRVRRDGAMLRFPCFRTDARFD